MIRFIIFLCLIFNISLHLHAQPAENKYLAGKIKGELPFLEYGLGADRLGGAKMTFLDTGIVVKVVDSTIINYKVQLSKNHFGYLQKSNFQEDSNIKIQPYYLTNNWLVSGDEKFYYVAVTLDEKLPYRSFQLINPSKIVVDIFGATSNTNWITQLTSAAGIKNVYYEQIEDDVFRVIIELTHTQHWGYSIYYEENKLVIKIKRQPRQLTLQNLKIAVDAGHGGTNIGANGVATRIQEKNYTLMIAKELEKALVNEGANVFMTRNTDETLTMPERISLLKSEDPDLLISIHLNSSEKADVKGVSTYYRYIGFRPLSQYILESMIQLGLTEFGNIGSFNFGLNGPTDYPNCLVEVAFLSNKEDEKLILDHEFHVAVACQVTDGIKKWLKSCSENPD